jgi:hypothetical protein
MTKLSPAADALVADIARSYGLAGLAPDADGALRVDIDGQEVVIAFSNAWGSVFLTSVLAMAVALPGPELYRAFALRARFQGRTTRVAREPHSGALVLVAEISLTGLHYAAFAAALSAFLADARLARAELALPTSLG